MPPARPMVVDPGSYKANTEPQPLYRWDVGQAFQPDSPTPRRGLADDVRLESLTYGTVDATEERQHATSMWHVWHRPRSHPATWAILTVEQDFSHDHQHADLWVDLINCWSPTPRRRARGPSGGRAAASWAV
jgi:hypothetical protein